MKIPSNKINTIIVFFKDELKELYPKEEIQGFVFLAFEHILGYSKSDVLINQDATISESELLKFNFLIKDLKKFKPIQYILGVTEFFNLKFKVGPGVLIPRPETEELVDLIIKENQYRDKLSVLDIGTGSGCISLALKHNLPQANIHAYDISSEALSIAKENAIDNKLDIKFEQKDILKYENYETKCMFDIIVSNPPYILSSERSLMHKNVLDYEPHTALFVDDDDPFIFYKAIGCFGLKYLKDKGKLYFEINEKFEIEIIEVFEKMGYVNCIVKKDLNNKNRFLIVNKL